MPEGQTVSGMKASQHDVEGAVEQNRALSISGMNARGETNFCKNEYIHSLKMNLLAKITAHFGKNMGAFA